MLELLAVHCHYKIEVNRKYKLRHGVPGSVKYYPGMAFRWRRILRYYNYGSWVM